MIAPAGYALAGSALAAAMAFAAAQPATDGAGPPITGTWSDMFGETQHPSATYRVRLFVHAAQACLHFSGEEAYDAERASFLAAMIDDNCTGLAERYAAIMADPSTDARARKLVDTVWEPLHE